MDVTPSSAAKAVNSVFPAANPVASIAVAQWSALMMVVYLVFCWLAWNRTLIADEVWAIMYAERSWSEQLASIRADLVHPPLFYVVERVWFKIFGVSDSSAKELPVLINLLSISLFPVLAARVTRSWRLASVLVLTTYLHVFAVPNLVRSYPLVLLLTIVSVWSWDAWRRQPTASRLAVWTAIMCLAVLTHFFCVLLLVSFVLLTWSRGPERKSLTLAAVIPALVFCAWVIYVFPVFASRGVGDNLKWVDPSLGRAILTVPFHLLTMIPSGSNAAHVDWWSGLRGMKYLVFGAAGINALLIVVAFLNQRSVLLGHRWLWQLTVLGFGPAVMLAGASLFIGPAFHTRFLVGSVPVYWLWVAVLADEGGMIGKVILRAVILPAVLLAVALPLRYDLEESPLREAVTKIVHGHQPGDVVLIASHVDFQTYWELREAGLDVPIEVIPASPVFQGFVAPIEDAPRPWVMCLPGECSAKVNSRLVGHRLALKHGLYLRLMQRER
jgi:hypothetical protein